jgi:uncharacterized protein YciI
MERIKQLLGLSIIFTVIACKGELNREPDSYITNPAFHSGESYQELRTRLASEGFEVFDFIDPKTGDSILMQQYFMAFLKSGQTRSQTKEEADSLQTLHLAHLQRMYDLGYADISGPFGDDGDIRGITIYNVPTLEFADSLANLDPSVRAGRLEIEIHPWWAAKGFPLR